MNIQGAAGAHTSFGASVSSQAANRQSATRVMDLIEQLRVEFEAVSQEIKSYRSIRDEYRRKVEAQVAEMSTLEQSLAELERKNIMVKEHYETEIMRLKQQLTGAPAIAVGSGGLRETASATLPGLSRGALPPGNSVQLPNAFPSPGAATSSLPTKRMRNHDVKATTTSTIGPLGGIGLNSNGLNTEAARSGTSVRDEVDQTPNNDRIAVSTSATGANASENDYIVYQGRPQNGNLLNMNVKLQNSFAHDSVVCCVRYSWNGHYLATGSNKCAQIFDAVTGAKLATFGREDGTGADDATLPDSYVRAVCFSPDGKWLITGSEDRLVKVWDARTRTVKHRLAGHDTDIYSVDASADGNFIVSGSGDKKAKLWDLNTGNLLHTLNGGDYGPTDGITSVSVSPTSHHVAAGSLDKIVRVWDVESGRLVRSYEGHRDSVYSVAFSPDCRMLLSGSLDKTLKLWDLAASNPSRQCRISFTGHKDFVLSVAFSPTGRLLMSGSKDRTVQFWDPRQPSMCLMLQGHKNSVISIAHSPKDKALATGSGDSRARTWIYTD